MLPARCTPLALLAPLLSLLAAPAAWALPFGTIGGPADSLIRVEGGSHCSPPGTMCVEAINNLPLADYALDGSAEIRATGSIDHVAGELRGYVDFTTQTGAGSDGRIVVHARDDFTVHGGTPGETITLTARLRAEGSITFLGEATARSAVVETKLSRAANGWSATNGGLVVSTGDLGFFSPCGFPGCTARPDLGFYAYDVEAEDTFDVVVGQSFQLAYSLRLDGFTIFNGPSSVIQDSLGTGRLSFDLGPGYGITSRLGFTAPEPGAALLLAAGLLGLAAVARRQTR